MMLEKVDPSVVGVSQERLKRIIPRARWRIGDSYRVVSKASRSQTGYFPQRSHHIAPTTISAHIGSSSEERT